MKNWLVVVLVIFVHVTSILAQDNYIPSSKNLENRTWFQDAKFGLFIHWGVYSILGDGEWVMQQQNINTDRYELLPNFFNPEKFDAEEIVSLAKAAGMKYITITTKHHDGFAMYDSQVSDYDIVDSTPFQRDIFRELEQACKKAGIKLFAYYSQLDWHHPDYYPRGKTGHDLGRPETGHWQDYLKYQNAQIKEIAENYDIAGFWFDGYWDQNDLKKQGKASQDFKLEDTYKLIHSVNSGLLIGNNHHLAPINGEDFQMFEKDLPGKNTAGFSDGTEIGNLPLETCETINHSWGFNLQDAHHKSSKELIRYLVKAAGNNANFLLNIGPMPNGDIQEEHKTLLKEVGMWMQNASETIYDTRAGEIQKEQIVSTYKKDTLYLHLLDENLQNISVTFEKPIKSICYFSSGDPINFKQQKSNLTFDLDANQMNPIDTIIQINL